MYLAYALFCERPSDFAYFEVLIPRLIDSIVSDLGVRPVDRPDAPTLRLGQPNRTVEVVAMEACRAKDAFHLAFIHADTGGRSQEGDLDGRSVAYCRKIHEICDFPQPRCVLLLPRRETEAWALADPNAVLEALGYRGPAAGLGLPSNANEAEHHQDPKSCLSYALRRGQQQSAAPGAHTAAHHRPTSIDRRVETIGILQRLRIPTQDGAARCGVLAPD